MMVESESVEPLAIAFGASDLTDPVQLQIAVPCCLLAIGLIRRELDRRGILQFVQKKRYAPSLYSNPFTSCASKQLTLTAILTRSFSAGVISQDEK